MPGGSCVRLKGQQLPELGWEAGPRPGLGLSHMLGRPAGVNGGGSYPPQTPPPLALHLSPLGSSLQLVGS